MGKDRVEVSKEEFLLQLAREELTDNRILEEYSKHYEDGKLDQAKWDLKTKIPCCMSSALLACEKLENITKAPSFG